MICAIGKGNRSGSKRSSVLHIAKKGLPAGTLSQGVKERAVQGSAWRQRKGLCTVLGAFKQQSRDPVAGGRERGWDWEEMRAGC